MIGTNFMEEIDCGSFFDHIDDLLDVPGGEEIEAGLVSADGNSFPAIWSAESESLPGSDSVFSTNSNSDLSAELSVPYEDIVQLEWLSNFVEDSFSGGRNLTMNNNKKEEASIITTTTTNPFQTSSPVSVLESSSSCSGEKMVPHSPKDAAAAVGPTRGKKRGRARSKRPRPTTFSPRPPIQLISSSSPTSSENSNRENEKEGITIRSGGTDSRLVIKIPKQALSENKKRKKIRVSAGSPEAEGKENQQGSVRKCMHCEVTRTPQWRAGPMGPKTLCNACGVRFKSGRLFPEYRPAASPTFVPSIHSNSHKKVIEMRNNYGEKGYEGSTGSAAGDCGELIPNQNNNLALDYM